MIATSGDGRQRWFQAGTLGSRIVLHNRVGSVDFSALVGGVLIWESPPVGCGGCAEPSDENQGSLESELSELSERCQPMSVWM